MGEVCDEASGFGSSSVRASYESEDVVYGRSVEWSGGVYSDEVCYADVVGYDAGFDSDVVWYGSVGECCGAKSCGFSDDGVADGCVSVGSYDDDGVYGDAAGVDSGELVASASDAGAAGGDAYYGRD